MKKVIITCDVCGTEATCAAGEKNKSLYMQMTGKEREDLDLCSSCLERLRSRPIADLLKQVVDVSATGSTS